MLQAATIGAARRHDFVLCALAFLGGAFVLVAGNADAVQFQALQTLQGGIGFTTVLELGPEDPDPASNADGCIYAVNGGQGSVSRVCFDANKNVTSNNVVIDINGGGGTNNTLGITIDPDSDPAGEIHLYLGYSDNNGSPNAGKILRAVSTNGGASYTVDEDFITGLGRSSFDHQTNGIDFGPDGCLYISQGNQSNAGYDSAYAETRLSSGLLRACFKDGSGNVDPSFDRNCGGTNTQQACDVEVYASGLRNPYDIVWHSNGFLYNTDNDANPGFRDSCPNVANDFGCPCQQPNVNPTGDEINRIEEGKYYGSPNPYRANPAGLQCVGGNNPGDKCTTDANCGTGGTCQNLSSLCTDPICDDDVQCLYFSSSESAASGKQTPTPAQDPNDLYRAPINQSVSSTLDGITEYEPRILRPALGDFCSDWDGDLLVTAGPGTVRRYTLTNGGLGASHAGTGNLNGANGLDVVTGPDGTIYIATLNSGSVQYLKPISQPNPAAADYFASCSPGQQCVNNSCQVLAPCTIDADCDDSNACTQDTCNTGNGLCTNNPTPLNGTACDDGVACTIDTCQSGACVGVENCPVGQICNALTDVCEVPVTDVDNDGLFNSDPCPTDALNACFGPVAVDGTTGNDIRLNSGPACTTAFTDCRGESWVTDFGAQPNQSSSTCNLAGGCPVDATGLFGCTNAGTEAMFKCEHWDPGAAPELLYSFDVPDNVYMVNLLFMNSFTGTTGVGQRVFDITIEGNVVYPAFDPVAVAGGSVPVVRSAIIEVTDNNGLQIELGHLTENPAIKGIEILALVGCQSDAECNDGDQCTVDTCNTITHACENDAAAADGLDCDDGIFCTFQDTCSGGDCQPGIPDPQQCDDQVVCTNDICDLVQDCINTPNTGFVCDDGLACTASDVCTAGVCGGTDTCPAGQACDGQSGACGASGADNDNDDFSPPADCDDGDGNVFPGAPEICDGKDNDCGGQVDEGNPGSGGSCTGAGLGVCSVGTEECIGGAIQCVADNAPSPELCDGLDNDCDGQTDEGNPGGGGSCSTGTPGVCDPGTAICQGGTLACIGNQNASPEVCDGNDNDCDGQTDEGNPGGGASCTTGDPGLCSDGTITCTGGALDCEPVANAQPEVCNGLDDNCDGAVDEGNPGGGGACSTGALGVCDAGTDQCVAGAIECVGDSQATAEICDTGADEDCDGEVDEAADCQMCLPENTTELSVMTKRNSIKLLSTPNRDKVIAKGTFFLPAPGAISADTDDVTLRVTDETGVFYEGTVPAGLFIKATNGRKFSYTDRTSPFENDGLRQGKMSLKSDLTTTKYTFKAQELELPGFTGSASTVTIKIGDACYVDSTDVCVPSSSGKAVKCR